MAYREVTMIEIKEVLRLWLAGVPKKRIAATLCVDPKTVRRYIAQAEACGLRLDDGIAALTDELVSQVVGLLHTPPARAHGDSWSACQQQRESIEKLLARNVRLSKIRRLLLRQGVDIPYSTLHRYATEELGFARKAPTVPLVDGEPGTLYSLPTRLIGRRLRARADSKLVRFYDDGELVKTHPRLPKGQRATDPNDFPESKRGYAMRDVDFVRHQARGHGESIGLYAERLLDSPLPWTRMRLVYALLGLVARFGAEVVELNCRIALEADLLNLKRLRRMIEQAVQPEQPTLPTNVIPISRYLRPAKQYALPGLELSPHTNPEQDND
jgi:hypothetical protein